MIADVVAGLALAIWVYLAFGHGRFWRTSIHLPARRDPARWPPVAVVVPARDEAAVLPQTLPTLVDQGYPGGLRVFVVDDDSTDATSALAERLGAHVVSHHGPPPGWVGKVAAMSAGLDASGETDYVLFADADIAFPPGSVADLVRAAETRDLALVSQMARLRAESFAERVVVPAFVYFFAQLYPFARVNGPGRTAAAAGGCMLVRRSALVAAGGLDAIRDAVIDDVALGRLLACRGRIWLGLAPAITSVRAYPRFADLWAMVTRSAYTQLRYSTLLLAGTVVGLALTYLVPPVALITGIVVDENVLAGLGAAAWALMVLTYCPMLRFYRVSVLWSFALPLVAALYAAMTLDSARQHHRGRGAPWKGRVAAVGRSERIAAQDAAEATHQPDVAGPGEP